MCRSRRPRQLARRQPAHRPRLQAGVSVVGGFEGGGTRRARNASAAGRRRSALNPTTTSRSRDVFRPLSAPPATAVIFDVDGRWPRPERDGHRAASPRLHRGGAALRVGRTGCTANCCEVTGAGRECPVSRSGSPAVAAGPTAPPSGSPRCTAQERALRGDRRGRDGLQTAPGVARLPRRTGRRGNSPGRRHHHQPRQSRVLLRTTLGAAAAETLRGDRLRRQ